MAGRSIESFIRWLNTYNPTRSYLLNQFKLDKEIVSGEGHWLVDRDGVRYLDFLSQFGAVSFGHNHPELKQTLIDALQAQTPAFVQPTIPVAAQELADRLRDLTPGGLRHTIFTNSGSEAAEAAIKLARAKTGRQVILSATNAFHGKTLGALSATHKLDDQSLFGAPFSGFEPIPYGDLDALAERLSQSPPVAALLLEPIQGEGGVVLPPDGYLAAARGLCHQHGTLLVVDEVQTGLGRTGDLWGTPADAGAPDILLVAKALGGGILPIGACIVTQEAWDHEFGLRQTSTFAGNNLACRVALKVLELLERDDGQIVRHVKEHGQYLLSGLQQLQQEFPSVITAVRGRGLLAGVEFRQFLGDDSYSMAYFSDADYLPALLSSFLLNRHQVLTAPAFNSSRVVRLEPPFSVGRVEIDRALEAFADLCQLIERRDYARLLSFLIEADLETPQRTFVAPNGPRDASRLPAGTKFGFLMHYTADRDIVLGDPSFDQLSPEQLRSWKVFMQGEARVIYRLPGLRSKSGDEVHGIIIAMPLLPKEMMQRGRRKMLPLLREAITLAKEEGVEILGLGGFTSIVSKGGELLADGEMPVTSGSSLTAVAIYRGLDDLVQRLDLAPRELNAVIIGATGAIGRLTAFGLCSRVGRLTLVGNSSSWDGEKRTHEVAGELIRYILTTSQAWPPNSAAARIRESADQGCLAEICRPSSLGAFGGNEELSRAVLDALAAEASPPTISVSTDAEASLVDADVVICATSSREPFIEPEHLKPGAIVIDAARPANVTERVMVERPDVLVVEGGLVELPERVHFGPNIIGFRPGVNLACLAETMLLALEGDCSDHSIGQVIPVEELHYFESLADKHGFLAAPPHWESREVPQERLDDFANRVSKPAAQAS